MAIQIRDKRGRRRRKKKKGGGGGGGRNQMSDGERERERNQMSDGVKELPTCPYRDVAT